MVGSGGQRTQYPLLNEAAKVAGDARKAIEAGTGKPVITNQKASELNHVVTQMIEASAMAIFDKDDSTDAK